MNADGGRIAEIKGGFQAGGENLVVGEMIQAPMAFDLRALPLPAPGAYDFAIYIDGQHQRTLTAWATERPSEPSA